MDRRTLLALVGGCLFRSLILRRGGLRLRLTDDDPLMALAVARLVRHCRDTGTTDIDMPVSWLQRHLRLGHRRALELADALERQRVWSPLREGRIASRTLYAEVARLRRTAPLESREFQVSPSEPD